MYMKKQKIGDSKEGFTLLELLIVITIVAILSVTLVFILNPSETLQKSRDTQRMSDLSTLKMALSVFMTATSSSHMDGFDGSKCVDGGTAASRRLWISVPTATETITDAVPPADYTAGTSAWVQPATTAAGSSVNGSGWIPINLSGLIGGSPISAMPIDPVNRISANGSTAGTVTNGSLMYRYGCKDTPAGFEVDARLESVAYGPAGADNRAAQDGGDNPNLFEVGSNLSVLPGTNDF
jgi:prepilin-type N-terminal cleavage/methylation domain-containing protein